MPPDERPTHKDPQAEARGLTYGLGGTLILWALIVGLILLAWWWSR
jgi:hypothetical protein